MTDWRLGATSTAFVARVTWPSMWRDMNNNTAATHTHTHTHSQSLTILCMTVCHVTFSQRSRRHSHGLERYLSIFRTGYPGWLVWEIETAGASCPVYYIEPYISIVFLLLFCGEIKLCIDFVVGCWRGYLSGARCRLAYCPADATATHCLLHQ